MDEVKRQSMNGWRRGRIKCQWFDGERKRSQNDSPQKIKAQRERRAARKGK